MAVDKTITSSTPIPGTGGVTYGQARHVKRAYGKPLGVGTLLARDGAWDRKRVVTNVVYGGLVTTPNGDRSLYTITLQPLGQLFADGRMQPTKWGTKQVDYVLEVPNQHITAYELRGWHVVEPYVPQPLKPMPKAGRREYEPNRPPHVGPPGHLLLDQRSDAEIRADLDARHQRMHEETSVADKVASADKAAEYGLYEYSPVEASQFQPYGTPQTVHVTEAEAEFCCHAVGACPAGTTLYIAPSVTCFRVYGFKLPTGQCYTLTGT